MSRGPARNGTEQERGIVSISESVFLHTEVALAEANRFEQGSHLNHEVPQGSSGALKCSMKDNFVNEPVGGRSAYQQNSVVVHK